MKKLCLLLLMSVLFVFTACGSSNKSDPEDDNNDNPKSQNTVSEEKKEEKKEEKTPFGTWTNISWVQYSDDPEHYLVNDPRGLVVVITEDQHVDLKSHIDMICFDEFSSMAFGSWKLESDDDYSSHYIIYLDGYEHGYFDFYKETGKMYLNWVGKKERYNVQMSFDDYSCKSDNYEGRE